MKRTQVQFDEAQLATLRALAAEKQMSVSAIVRQAVDELVARNRSTSRDELWKRAAEVPGAFASGQTDTAREHDRYLAEALESE